MIFNVVEPLKRGVVGEEGKGVVNQIELPGFDSPFHGQCFLLNR